MKLLPVCWETPDRLDTGDEAEAAEVTVAAAAAARACDELRW